MEQKRCQKCERTEGPFYRSTGVTIAAGLYCWICVIDSVIFHLENAIEESVLEAKGTVQQ